jgi:hypothetical protein
MPTDRAADPGKAQSRATWYTTLNALAASAPPANTLAARFTSFADTVQTRLDTANGSGPSLAGSLEAQVDRALSQVLRQAPAGMPSDGATSLVTQALSALSVGTGIGVPFIAPQQAALVREATLIKDDLLPILDTLQPLSDFADASDIAAVTAIVRAEVGLLIEEFSRTTLKPRPQRIRVLLGGLLGWNALYPQPAATPYAGDVGALLTLLNLGGPLVPTVPVEQQLASQGVLASDVGQLLGQWDSYRQTDSTIPPPWEPTPVTRGPGGLGSLGPGGVSGGPMALGPASTQAAWRLAVIKPSGSPPSGSYTERLIQADLLLPVVGQDAARVGGALDAIGLSQGQQETTFLTLQSLVDMDLLLPVGGGAPAPPPAPPFPGTTIQVTTTVSDVAEWTAGMSDAKTMDLVRQGGQLGLNLIADQADELFWLVVALLSPNAQTQMPELGDAQVQQELLTLLRDLNLLAGLAV